MSHMSSFLCYYFSVGDYNFSFNFAAAFKRSVLIYYQSCKKTKTKQKTLDETSVSLTSSKYSKFVWMEKLKNNLLKMRNRKIKTLTRQTVVHMSTFYRNSTSVNIRYVAFSVFTTVFLFLLQNWFNVFSRWDHLTLADISIFKQSFLPPFLHAKLYFLKRAPYKNMLHFLCVLNTKKTNRLKCTIYRLCWLSWFFSYSSFPIQ